MNEYLIPYCIRLLVVITATIASFNYKKYNLSKERYFLHFLWFTVIIESIAAVLNHTFGDAYVIYNIFIIISFLFYLNWFRVKLQKKIVGYLLFMFIAVTSTNLFFQNPITNHLEFTFIFGAVSLLICTFGYFSNALKEDETFKLKQRLSFWIVIGLLFFHIGMIPLILLADVLDFSGIYYLSVLLGLNIILYGCYIIGFLWTKKTFNR